MSTFWTPDISDWRHQQEVTHPKHTALSNVAHNVFSIIQDGIGVGASFSIARDVIGGMQSNTTNESVPEKVVIWQFD